ncbi:MAG: Sjogren's syndrome/scleroderma autoantigen 1 family protein [Pyrodictiaceae archaeon]
MSKDYTKDPAVIKKMADLLRAGAAMLSERCPICGLPLFRLRSGEVVCPIHGRVFLVKDEAEYTRVAVEGVLEGLERLAASYIKSIIDYIETSSEPKAASENQSLKELLAWLRILERVEKVRLLISRTREASEKKS